jgi:hypothetical protein
MAFSKKNKQNTAFQKKCQTIFEWAGYRVHTKFHLNRFPLIGEWNAWQRLSERLVIYLEGRIPEKGNNETTEHVLDVILFQGQDLSGLKLVKTGMYTIMFIDDRSSIPVAVMCNWHIRFNEINGSIVSINYEKSTSEQASDDQGTNQNSSSNTSCQPSRISSRLDIVHLIKNRNINSNKIDVLSTIFDDIHNTLSEYQEEKIQVLMRECGALVYNEDLIADHIPDGYYLCDAECLNRLENIFNCKPHTFATSDHFRRRAPPDYYILLTVEVKLSFDSLQSRLKEENYYIFSQVPDPIRHLVIVNGGQKTHAWLFLINLAYVDSTNRETRIDAKIHGRSRELVERLLTGRTHIVYMPSFSSETFRQEPLTNDRLNILCELVKYEQKKDEYLISVPGISGWRKRQSDNERDVKKQIYSDQAFYLLDRFMKEYPIQKPRSSINFWILQQTEMPTVEQFGFLEQLTLSLLNEMRENVSKANQNIKLPNQLIKRARKLRTVEPVLVEESPTVPMLPSLVSQAPFPGGSDRDDNIKLGEQPT